MARSRTEASLDEVETVDGSAASTDGEGHDGPITDDLPPLDDRSADAAPEGRGREVDADPRDADEPPTRAPLPTLTIVLAVLAILGLAGTIFFGFKWNAERTEDNAAASMETTAGDFLVALFDFDGRTIDEDFDNILSYATGDFADQAEAQFADADTRAALREVQASSRVEVRDLFVQSFDGDRGRVFAVVDQTIANNQFPQPRSDQVRLELSLRKVDGEWRVANLDVLEAPAAAAAVAGGVVPTEENPPTTTP